MSTLTRFFSVQGGQCRPSPRFAWIAIQMAVTAIQILFSHGDQSRPLHFLFLLLFAAQGGQFRPLPDLFLAKGGQCRSLPDFFWIAIKMAVRAKELRFFVW